MIKITMTKEVWGVLKNNYGLDETRSAICRTILTQNNSVYATDGRRAVKFQMKEFSCSEPLKANSVYLLASETKAKASELFVAVYFELVPDLTPPDFSCVWINGERKEVLAVDVKKDSHFLTLAIIKIFDKTKRAINYDFIDALLYRQKNSSCLKVFVKEGEEQDGDKALLITSADIPFEAMLLPIIMDGVK
jgi:hypothetical protein